MQPGDRLVCAFIEQQPLDQQFKNWPLHVTIVPWFRLKDSSGQIAEGMKMALFAIKPFEAKVGQKAMFGPKRSRPANLLQPSSFSDVEQHTRSYLHKKRAWLVDETTKLKRPYRAHVTFQGDKQLLTGETVVCDRLYIVEQKGSYKAVVAIIELGHDK